MAATEEILPLSSKEYNCGMNNKARIERYKLEDETDEKIVTYMHVKTYPDGRIKEWKSRLRANKIRTFPKSVDGIERAEEISSKTKQWLRKVLSSI